MAEVERAVDAPVDRVWGVLADGWSYANWVVGTAHVRNVDDGWPAEGTRLHHNSGGWPLLVSDVTVVRRAEPPRLLVLEPQLRPLGRGTVVVRLDPLGPQRTRVTIGESFDHGMLRWMRVKANDLLLHRRNVESLRRLSHLATRRRPGPGRG